MSRLLPRVSLPAGAVEPILAWNFRTRPARKRFKSLCHFKGRNRVAPSGSPAKWMQGSRYVEFMQTSLERFE